MAEEDGRSQPAKIDFLLMIDGSPDFLEVRKSIKLAATKAFINAAIAAHYLRKGWVAAADFCKKEMSSDLDACMEIVESSRYFDVDAFSICKKLKRLDCLDAIKNKSYYSAAFQIDNVEARRPDEQIEYLKATGVIANAPNLCAHDKLLDDPRCRPLYC